jgi:hypothetical protein
MLTCKGDTLPALLVWCHHNLDGFPNSSNGYAISQPETKKNSRTLPPVFQGLFQDHTSFPGLSRAWKKQEKNSRTFKDFPGPVGTLTSRGHNRYFSVRCKHQFSVLSRIFTFAKYSFSAQYKAEL